MKFKTLQAIGLLLMISSSVSYSGLGKPADYGCEGTCTTVRREFQDITSLEGIKSEVNRMRKALITSIRD